MTMDVDAVPLLMLLFVKLWQLTALTIVSAVWPITSFLFWLWKLTLTNMMTMQFRCCCFLNFDSWQRSRSFLPSGRLQTFFFFDFDSSQLKIMMTMQFRCCCLLNFDDWQHSRSFLPSGRSQTFFFWLWQLTAHNFDDDAVPLLLLLKLSQLTALMIDSAVWPITNFLLLMNKQRLAKCKKICNHHRDYR